MLKSPFEDWLTVQEHKRSYRIFLVEWLALFALAWLFWSVMFFNAPGSVAPGVAAAVVAILYASAIIYGRVMRATGCRKCATPLPFRRKEVGRRHMRDEEHCLEIQYGSEEYGQVMIQVYSKVTRSDLVSYKCCECGQAWDERQELPGLGYRLIRRIDDPEQDERE